MKEVEPETGWIGGRIKCDVCSNEWLAVYHNTSEKLECPNCENMVTYELIEEAK
jgi:ribosomal protein S27E